MNTVSAVAALPDLWQVVYDTPWATAIRESEVLFPVLETIHVLTLGLIAGTISVVDLRLLGFVLKDIPAGQLERRIVPATWAGFAVMAITGSLLLASEAAKLEHNPAFLAKLALLFLAGANVLFFQVFAHPKLEGAPTDQPLPLLVRASAGLSLIVWIGVIAAGRAVAYFH
ncbi:MAG: DUF6644 family protein [Pseudomonadota bacterium]|jgi:hypothetical protein